MEYVVQVLVRGSDRGSSDMLEWQDVATVTVPAKTKRRTVVEKAAKQVGLGQGEPDQVRVIPAEHAEPIKVEMEQPPPQLKIGD